MGKIFSGESLGQTSSGSGGGGEGGVPEAPLDGQLFLRGNADWHALTAALSALWMLTPEANKLPLYTGDNTAELTTLSDFMRGVLAVADAGAALSLLEAQKENANLDALSGLASVKDQLPYFSDANAMAMTAFTAFARTLLAGADAAAMRKTLQIPEILSGEVVVGPSTNGVLREYPSGSGLGSYEFKLIVPGNHTAKKFLLSMFSLYEGYPTTFSITRDGEPVYDQASDETTVVVLIRRQEATMDHEGWGTNYVGFDWLAIPQVAPQATLRPADRPE